MDAIGAGLVRGVRDVIDKPAQMLANAFSTSEGQRVQALNEQGAADFKAGYDGSTAADVARIGGQVAATLPAAGIIGGGVGAAGALAAAPRVAQLGAAISSGGLTAQGASLATRAAGGAIAGGATAGLVDGEAAGSGALIGAALPGAVRGLGLAANRLGSVVRGPEVATGIREAAQAGQAAGYVVPPTQVNPSLVNRVMEGAAGKLSTAQNASARNQEVTNRLAREAIGAADLTPESLAAVRSTANAAYDALGRSAPFVADDAFRSALQKATGNARAMTKDFPELRNSEVEALVDGLSSRGEFGAQSTIEAIKQMRFNGSANRASLDPAKKALGSVQMKVAGALEDLIDRNLERTGQQELLTGYRAARQTLAKVYDIEKALNPTTGNVDAAKLAAALKKGKPLSGTLREAAEFAQAFPKAVQTPERMGSLPGTSPLDWAAVGGIAAASGGNPLSFAGLAARPLARAAALSAPVQRGLVRAAEEAAQPRLGVNPGAAALLGRTAYAAPASRDQ
ncbi:hypothetical protein [Xenophilus sp. Marseille-Q4582]|uniref:hypothetical protein n=1 Tax=Xenophilus sp. Marseille-Q4582 TaxID=2866600 RepID=UPI001CE49BA2|nr:hypothetical protein [Xenophilus sp. Marseille-Q4582]